MRIGLFFGSFNPPHVGHTIIAQHMLEAMKADTVWMVVSPQNPFKERKGLLDEHARLELVQLATKELDKIEASNLEFNLEKPSYTIDTMRNLKTIHPEDEFFLIMGSDNILKIDQWKDYEDLLSEYSIAVYPRKGYKVKKKMKASLPDSVQFIACPIIDMSSTEIRRRIASHQAFESMVRADVAQKIVASNYYQKT